MVEVELRIVEPRTPPPALDGWLPVPATIGLEPSDPPVSIESAIELRRPSRPNTIEPAVRAASASSPVAIDVLFTTALFKSGGTILETCPGLLAVLIGTLSLASGCTRCKDDMILDILRRAALDFGVFPYIDLLMRAEEMELALDINPLFA